MNTAYLLMSTSKKLRYSLNNSLESIDITAQQFSVLQHIHHLSKNQVVTAIDLGNHLDMDKPTVSGILTRLENKEFIIRTLHPTDKRAYTLSLSKKGNKKLADGIIIADNVLDAFLHPLSNEEVKQLTILLNKLDMERK